MKFKTLIQKKHFKRQGFTLIEMMVALAIFIMVVAMSVGLFSAVLKAQRKTYNLQMTQDTSRYLIEMMAKEIRMSKIINIALLGNDVSRLRIERLDELGTEVRYRFYNDQPLNKDSLTREKGVNERVLHDKEKISIRGYFYGDTKRVTIVLEAKSKTARPGEEAVVRLQTSVTSRYYGP